MLKKFGAVCLAAVLLLTGCTLRPQENGSKVQSISRPAVESAELQFTHPAAGEPVAVFDTTAGVFKAVLFPEQAPQAYDNFVGLVQAGYYNGLTVTRVEQDFVVEAGQGADGRAPPSGTAAATRLRPPTSSTIIPVPSAWRRTPPASAPASFISCPLCPAGIPSPRNSLTR